MILVRTHRFGERERLLLERLQGVRRHTVVVAVDETKGPVDVSPFPKLSVTRKACERLGLYCPDDFGWRNGDYVFYLARKQFPKERYFWMLEPDVEHSFASDAAMFERLDGESDADLLISYLRPSTFEWWWHQTARPRSTGVRQALFCLVRMSAEAIDVCLQERKRGRFSLRERLYWPNDEAFVATEVVHAGLRTADFNDFHPPLYTPETLSFQRTIDGTDGSFRKLPDMLYHPVLYGAAYRERVERFETTTDTPRDRWVFFRRRLQRLLRRLAFRG